MFSAKVDFNRKKVKGRVDSASKFAQTILDTQVLKDSNFYIPMDQHFLERSGISHSRIGQGHVGWGTPYARRLYYNPQYNFSTDKNPNAQGKWYEVAKARHRKAWLQAAQKAFKNKF